MSSRSDEPVYHAVWPRSPRGVQARRRADRLSSLEGTRIAFLWDYLFRGDELFPVLEAELRERFPGVDIVGYDVFGFKVKNTRHNVDELARIIPDSTVVMPARYRRPANRRLPRAK